MKQIFLAFSLVLLLQQYCKCQDVAVLEGNTITYKGVKYSVGDTIQIKYGSHANKAFAFINYGSSMSQIPATPALSKSKAVIEKVYYKWKRMNVTAVHLGSSQRFYIMLEGAVDNGEL